MDEDSASDTIMLKYPVPVQCLLRMSGDYGRSNRPPTVFLHPSTAATGGRIAWILKLPTGFPTLSRLL